MRKSKIYNYTPEELQELLNISHSYSDILISIGLSAGGGCHNTLKRIVEEYNLDKTQFLQNKKEFEHNRILSLNKNTKISLEDILVENSTYTNNLSLKRRLINEGFKELKCERCGLIEWQGYPIPLQLHHKNGIHTDNRLLNLEILCPNCHSLTDTYAGKNVKYNTKKYFCKECGKEITRYATYCKKCASQYKKNNTKCCCDRDYLKNIIYNTSFEEIGRSFNVTGNTVKKWCKKFNLPYKRSDIVLYTKEEWDKL